MRQDSSLKTQSNLCLRIMFQIAGTNQRIYMFLRLLQLIWEEYEQEETEETEEIVANVSCKVSPRGLLASGMGLAPSCRIRHNNG